MLQSVFLAIVIFGIFRWFLNKQRELVKEATQPLPSPQSEDDEFTRSDIYHVAFLLQKKLPPELVPQILDYAECWLKSTVTSGVRAEVEDTRGGARRSTYSLPPGSCWLSTLSIGNVSGVNEDGVKLVGQHPVRKIVFTIESRDQGWSSYPEHHGTENHSWTWFEAFVRDANQPSFPNLMAGREQDDSDEESEGDSHGLLRGRTICSNVHAGAEWRKKTVVWNADDADEEVRDWVRALKRGQVVDLTVWAKYPGWTNRVRFVRIDVYVAAVR